MLFDVCHTWQRNPYLLKHFKNSRWRPIVVFKTFKSDIWLASLLSNTGRNTSVETSYIRH